MAVSAASLGPPCRRQRKPAAGSVGWRVPLLELYQAQAGRT